MRLVYIDDSKQDEPRRRGLGPLVALGGVIVPEAEVVGYSKDLTELRSELGIPMKDELKWKPPKGSFLAQAGGDVVATLRRQMLERAIARNICSVVIIIDHGKAYKALSAAEVGREALKWLYERVTMHLDMYDERGIIVADKPGGGPADESRWLAETLGLTSDGTEYIQPGRIVMPIVTAPSHHVPLLQLADLVVAASTAAVAGFKHGLALGAPLLQMAHKNAHDSAAGAGIVLWPAPQLTNLQYWAFGEGTYSKVAMNTGWPLPWRGWPYHDENGL